MPGADAGQYTRGRVCSPEHFALFASFCEISSPFAVRLRRGDRELTPADFVHLDRLIKTFWADRASAQKQRRLTRRLRDHLFSREDLIGFRVRAESESQLHRPSKQIIIVLNRLAHAQTNPQVQGRAGMLNIIRGERLLNRLSHIPKTGR